MPSIWYWCRGYLCEQTTFCMKQPKCPFEVLIPWNYWEMPGSFLMILISLLAACGGEAVLVLHKKCKVPQILTALAHYWCSRMGNLYVNLTFLPWCLFDFGKQESNHYGKILDVNWSPLYTYVHTKQRKGKPLIFIITFFLGKDIFQILFLRSDFRVLWNSFYVTWDFLSWVFYIFRET